MKSRVVESIVIKAGPAPAAATHHGRSSKYAAVRRAIDTLRPGEWFGVPGSETLAPRENALCREAIRKHLRVRSIEGVRVYRDESGHVIVRCEHA